MDKIKELFKLLLLFVVLIDSKYEVVKTDAQGIIFCFIKGVHGIRIMSSLMLLHLTCNTVNS